MNFMQDPILGGCGQQNPSAIDQMAELNNEYAKKVAEMQKRGCSLSSLKLLRGMR